MGARNPDTVRSPPSPGQAVTLSEIRARSWTVRATCVRCKVSLHVDLAPMLALQGPDFILWGKSPRCRVWAYGDDERCPGRVMFEVRSVRGGSWRAMRMSAEVIEALNLRGQHRSQAHDDLGF